MLSCLTPTSRPSASLGSRIEQRPAAATFSATVFTKLSTSSTCVPFSTTMNHAGFSSTVACTAEPTVPAKHDSIFSQSISPGPGVQSSGPSVGQMATGSPIVVASTIVVPSGSAVVESAALVDIGGIASDPSLLEPGAIDVLSSPLPTVAEPSTGGPDESPRPSGSP